MDKEYSYVSFVHSNAKSMQFMHKRKSPTIFLKKNMHHKYICPISFIYIWLKDSLLTKLKKQIEKKKSMIFLSSVIFVVALT